MRFLCLHGMGTNSRVFETQTAKIRHALGPGHEFIFVDGTVPWAPAPGVQELATENEEFLRYIVVGDVSTLKPFYSSIKSFVLAEGPFDGIMGFSEGGGLAASMIVEQFQNPRSVFTFKCGIFFSAGWAVNLHDFLESGLRTLDPCSEKDRILIPTAHIWDPEDDVHPGFGSEVKNLCVKNQIEEYQHEFGHAVPGAAGTLGVVETVRAISRTIERSNAL